MRYSVTGTVDLPDTPEVGRLLYKQVWSALQDATEFTTGGAFGIDTTTAYLGWSLRIRLSHSVLLRGCFPEGRRFNDITLYWVDRVEMIPGGYMKRNDVLVAHADVLLAFPKTPQEELRSGTWATIRRARKAGVEVRLFPLSEA
jgi:hypothetical protein